MPLVPQPTWSDFPAPPGVDLATANDFSNLAAQELGQMDAGDLALAGAAASILTGVAGEESGALAMLSELDTAAIELDALAAAADVDTLLEELTTAGTRAAALDLVITELEGASFQIPILGW